MQKKHLSKKSNNIRTKVYKNGMIICVIFLLIGIGTTPITSSMEVVKEKNNQGIVNFHSDTLFRRNIDKNFFIGRIQNLTIKKDDYQGYDYDFETHNIREFQYWRYSIRAWGFHYDHYVGHGSFGFYGYNFRGLLRPTFICGYFYFGFPISH